MSSRHIGLKQSQDLDLDQYLDINPSRPLSEEGRKPSKRLPIVLNDDLLKLYGNKQWHSANAEARSLITREPAVTLEGEPINFKPIEGVERAYDYLAQSYVDYVLLLKIMMDSLRQLLHPQKRLLFKRFIESTAGRVCELKMEMTRLCCTNIHNMVGYCADLGITPEDLEFMIPESMLQDQIQTIKLREEMLGEMLKKLQTSPGCTLKDLLPNQPDNNRTSTLNNTKLSSGSVVSERNEVKNQRSSRQSTKITASSTWSRTRSVTSALSAFDANKRRNTVSVSTIPTEPDPAMTKNSDDLDIQDFITSRRYKKWLNDPEFNRKVQLLQYQWRVWLERKETLSARRQLDIFCEMERAPAQEIKGNSDELAAKHQVLLQTQEEEYKSAVETLANEYTSGSEAEFDRWALRLNIEQWILELRDLLGKCPSYPPPEMGGCSALFSDKTVAEVEAELEDIDEKEKKKKPEEKKKKGKGADAKEKGKKEKEEGFKWSMPKSAILPDLVCALGEYVRYWNLKLEEENPEQRMDLQLVKEKVRAEAEETIRKSVDAMIAAELERLRAVDREPPPRKDKKKQAKSKGKRGKTDALAGRSVEELYCELVLAGIIQNPQQVTMNDLVGFPNMVDKKLDICRLASSSDTRMAIREMFGLPLCSGFIHSSVEHHKSLLLAGPPGVGKSLIVDGLCRETGANLFNLSPKNLVGKYQGKKLENELMNVLLKVGKALQPTILLVDECHLLFPTKRSPNRPHIDRDKPGRWAKVLTVMMKKIKPGDRILLVGITQEPFLAKTKGLCNLFKDIFLVPFPDYGSRRALWEHYLGKLELARPHNVNASILAKLTEGYTGNDIKAIVEKSCPAKRQKRKVRLRHEEMLPALTSHYPKEQAPTLEDWVKWFLATPKMKARDALLQAIAEEEELAALAKAGKKKKK